MINQVIRLYDYLGGKGDATLTALGIEDTEEKGSYSRPALLIMPGGGYEFVSSREAEPVALPFLNAGYRVFILNYTINAAYPVPLVEAAGAMAFIREHAKEYSVDVNHVCAVGFSAGGHLTGMLANLFDAEEIKSALKDKAKLVRPDAVILSYPVLSTKEGITHEGTANVISGRNRELRKRLSLEDCVKSSSAPAFIWHTMEDDCVPVENSLCYAAACRKQKVPFELHIFEKGWHGLSVANVETERDPNRLSFIKQVQAWVPLALTFLAVRGFCAKNV